MGNLINTYCYGAKESPEIAARRKYLSAKCTIELIAGCIPVFVAAGLSNFVSSIIVSIADSTDDKYVSEVGQTFVYAIVVYIFGLFGTAFLRHYILLDRVTKNKTDYSSFMKFMEIMNRRNISEDLISFFTENSAFAWKEFTVAFFIEYLYEEDGFGKTFGWFLTWIAAYMIIALIVYFIVININFRFNGMLKELLYFSSDAFALSLAAAFTLILANGSSGAGLTYISRDGYFFNEADDDNITDSYTNLNYLYVVVVTVLVGIILMIEDRFICYKQIDLDSDVEVFENSIVDELYRESSLQLYDGNTSKSTAIIPPLEEMLSVYSELWHNFLGCFCGVAYFSMVVDCFLPLGGHKLLGALAVCFFIAALLSWRAPEALASTILNGERVKLRLKNKRDTNATAERVSCWDQFLEYYYHAMFRRRAARMVAIRLTVGWLWEEFMILVFKAISKKGKYREKYNILVQFEKENRHESELRESIEKPAGNRGLNLEDNSNSTTSGTGTGRSDTKLPPQHSVINPILHDEVGDEHRQSITKVVGMQT